MSEREPNEETYEGETYAEADYDPNPEEEGKWISGLIALVGLWLVVEAFLFDFLLLGNVWNDAIVGVLLVALGGYNYYRRADEEPGSVAAAGLAALLGLWMVVSPFVYGLGEGWTVITTQIGFWNDVIVGLVVLALGVYSAYEARDLNVGTTATDR